MGIETIREIYSGLRNCDNIARFMTRPNMKHHFIMKDSDQLSHNYFS